MAALHHWKTILEHVSASLRTRAASIATGFALVAGVAVADAQCPDGSPPPCGGRRAPYVSVSTRRLPDSVRLLYDRAVEEARYRTSDGAQESLNLLSRVLRYDSNYAPAWAALSRVSQQGWLRRWTLSGAGRDSLLVLAIRASRRAVQLDSALPSAWVAYARAAGSVDATDRAASRHALNRALTLDPRNLDALFELGLLEEELLHPVAAEQAWRRALAIAPTHRESLTFLALHYFWQLNYARARRLADSALTIDPAYAVAREAAADIALMQRRWDDAERHVRSQGHAGGGQEPLIGRTLLARASAGRGDIADARRHMQDAERSADLARPSRHEAAYLGAAWAVLGDTARSLQWLRAYSPRNDLHYQLHIKRDPALRWIATKDPSLLARNPD